MRLFCVGRDVWVGDHEACSEHADEFARVVHIWRPENIKEGRLCRCLRESCGRGLPLRYSEGRKLAEADQPIDFLARYVGGEGRLLVHCAGGACRSPTVALLALAERGEDPFDAVRDIYRIMWDSFRMPPIYFDHPVAEILSWWERNRGGPT